MTAMREDAAGDQEPIIASFENCPCQRMSSWSSPRRPRGGGEGGAAAGAILAAAAVRKLAASGSCVGQRGRRTCGRRPRRRRVRLRRLGHFIGDEAFRQGGSGSATSGSIQASGRHYSVLCQHGARSASASTRRQAIACYSPPGGDCLAGVGDDGRNCLASPPSAACTDGRAWCMIATMQMPLLSHR